MIINNEDIIKTAKINEDEKKGIIDVFVTDVNSLKNVALSLSKMGFDHCLSVTCVDYRSRMSVIWHVSSYSNDEYKGHVVQLRIDVDTSKLVPDPKYRAPMIEVPSLVEVWKSAEFHERETHEMFGVNFQGHPDLRQILLPEDFYGKWPMRKDFTFNKSGIKYEFE
ncbi:MAG: NADH-quinone oxidoreductase subunit C [Nitrososphaerota archaeon]|jgi:NADH-quinone oxidoreductase subunit C|nr:NADH-quinone oxidoreductase subunit C [Nitrososphaerota archaeon]MDG6927608.1 NADH-quinone oxidoreductase subunit C [Nitrososphaerota archaeon]MDG6929931.1 NADH-quinone oxidoreductase subunit C [Nitrososphaerota archaeon]MDG6931619.1 NADH-quinone oxidoreductase subunit C [Nitrososphaerota archaeon]MDG6935964.1 NADH-quinone oxidoreductase subunit C [Nitrososphaerota archaeon]